MKCPIAAVHGSLLAAALSIGAAGPASADPVADKSRITTTADGWQVRVSKTKESLDRVPNLAATAFSREGFVSLTAVADVTGHGSMPVDEGTLTMGYEIGCQIDVSNGVNTGMQVPIRPNMAVNAQVTPNISTSLRPGMITSVTLATKELAKAHGSITAEQVQINVDACMGPVSLRSFAIASISTDTTDHSVAVYGDPIWL